MKDSDSDELVWYLAYGSNLKMERFLKYIGKCRDSRQPRLDQNFKTRHQLYFAKNAPRWENKAVAFIRPKASDDFETLGRRFLISREQLEDVLAQENGADSGDSRFSFPLSDFESQDSKLFRTGWYDLLIRLRADEKDEWPMFTLTSSTKYVANVPSLKYLKVVAAGLHQTWWLSTREIAEYLLEKEGIAGNFDFDALSRML